MKLKITAITTVLFIILGCAFVKDYIEPEKRVIVSCLAIDYKDGFVFTIETAVGDKEGNILTSVYSASGNSSENTMQNLKQKSYGKLLFSQCPVILLSQSVTGENLKQLLLFLFDNNDISLSVKFVCCNTASELLTSETNKPAGYEIETLLNSNSQYKPLSFAEIIDKELRGKNEFYLPFAEKQEERFVLNKFLIYEDFLIKEEKSS
jgi:hypothetical protein